MKSEWASTPEYLESVKWLKKIEKVRNSNENQSQGTRIDLVIVIWPHCDLILTCTKRGLRLSKLKNKPNDKFFEDFLW